MIYQTKFHSYIKSLALPYRGNCPACFNKNTFIATENSGYITYHCFHASCKLKGKIEHEISIDSIRNIFNTSSYNNDFCVGSQSRNTLYGAFTSPIQNATCYAFLKRFNLVDFYAKHSQLIRYDPKQNRCVFILIDDKGENCGATGRSLTFLANPRWFVYYRNSGAIYSPDKFREYTVLVEDCVSASVASQFFNSSAILGTSISDATIGYLLNYNKLFIALDPDALSKSLVLQKRLSAYRPTEILTIETDLKYYTNNQLQEIKKYVEDSSGIS